MKLESSEIFKILGVDTRVKIIYLLKSKGPLGANSIAEHLKITPAAVSQHLKLLKQAGLVKNQRQGYWIPYFLDETALEECRQKITEVCACGCGCHEDRKLVREELDCKDVASLKKYEQKLQQQIQRVRARIEQLESLS
jgi:DNA-binding transcriptional ArsR family regulator